MVCDVGGGTTDLTLIQVAIKDGTPTLTRIGVGDHLMLGGDNMDLALAHLVEGRLPAGEGRLSAARFSQLTARCRAAKEQLLAAGAPAVQLTLLGGGSRLIGGARSVELQRDEVLQVIVDGFFPRVAADEPIQQRRAAIVEFGLPYPADPAITRHVAAFLRRHAQAARQALGDEWSAGQLPLPDTLLFNGGVFRAEALAERLQSTLGDWRGAPCASCTTTTPMSPWRAARSPTRWSGKGMGSASAAARRAAISWFSKIRGQRRRGICVLPRGTEEGHEVRLPERTFSLRLGQPVRFHLASSVADASYLPGEIAALDDEDFVRLPPIATVVQAPAGSSQREVRVQLLTAMTEVGTLEIHCVAAKTPPVAGCSNSSCAATTARRPLPSASLPARFADAVQAIERIFGASSQPVDNKEVRRLRGHLEHLLGKRDDWEMPLLRALFDALMQRARRRRRSAEHERLWLNLSRLLPATRPGRPARRVADRATVRIAAAGNPVRPREPELVRMVDPLATRRRRSAARPAGTACWPKSRRACAARPTRTRSRQATAIAGSHDDMLRLVASLERLPIERKVEIGDWLLDRLRKASEKPLGWWALGRIGARQSLYGSAHQVVPPEVAERWLQALLATDWKKVEPAAFAATQIARLTGDRSRDLADELRAAGPRRAWRRATPVPPGSGRSGP
jgi:hypothetical protein